MIQIHKSTGASVIAVQEVPKDMVSSYGIVLPGGECAIDRWRAGWVNDLIEQSAKEDAPSNLAAIGRYVLRSEVFEVLVGTQPGPVERFT